MADGKKELELGRWLRSAESVFKGDGRSPSLHSEGKNPGASSPVMNTASGSATDLLSGSSRHGSNCLTPTDTHSIRAAVISSHSGTTRQSIHEQVTAPKNAGTIAQDSRVSQSSARATAGAEETLPGGKPDTPHVSYCALTNTEL